MPKAAHYRAIRSAVRVAHTILCDNAHNGASTTGPNGGTRALSSRPPTGRGSGARNAAPSESSADVQRRRRFLPERDTRRPTRGRCVCSCTPLRSSARTNMITAASRHQRIRLRINRVAADQVTCGDPGNPTQAACAHLIYFSAATPACVTPERPGSGRAHGRPGEGPPALTRPQAEPHTYPERLPPRGADRTRGARLNATGASWRYHASGGAAPTPAA